MYAQSMMPPGVAVAEIQQKSPIVSPEIYVDLYYHLIGQMRYSIMY